jgi:hypothetical protein
MISLDSVVEVTTHQVSAEILSESVILHLTSGEYYGLNAVGNSIWKLIQQPQSVSDICSAILEEYRVERSQCEHDVLLILQDLQTEGLIHVRN